MESLSLLRRLCSNFGLNGASLEFDLNISFAKVLEFKKNTEETSWCPGPDLNRHDPVKESQDFKSCASTNFATGASENFRKY